MKLNIPSAITMLREHFHSNRLIELSMQAKLRETIECDDKGIKKT